MAKKKTKTGRKTAKEAARRAAKTTRKAPARPKTPTLPKAAAQAERKPMVARRDDLGQDVTVYFASLGASQRSLAERLDRIVRAAAPMASAAIKWGMPVYEHRGMLCYIRARPNYVTFGFYEQGTSLSDPKGLLEGTGDNMRHIKLAGEGGMDDEYLSGLVRQAVRFNESA